MVAPQRLQRALYRRAPLSMVPSEFSGNRVYGICLRLEESVSTLQEALNGFRDDNPLQGRS